MKWKNINSAWNLPADFMSIGQESPCGRFYVGARYTGSRSGQLNWAVLDLQTGTFVDKFRYRRDAKHYAEMYLQMEGLLA